MSTMDCVSCGKMLPMSVPPMDAPPFSSIAANFGESPTTVSSELSCSTAS
eukprot:CAMPEP_0195077264 /NCGR_PEP_ID=MMETSP0448-20130528/19736_1 /TAXON_ID=66468 /ORGANISM="Heterocapsa triquestra, Strain CCMP 448" /LENGTH=49 /DNA_ID= /DNA_START= /DNA_END= /DNA_ORIENTATION=